MTSFVQPKETWNARFATDDYLFGREPNAFLASQAHRFAPGQRALCVADGEGRNSVWLAQQGLVVDAFDLAPNAVRKARTLAAERGVSERDHVGQDPETQGGRGSVAFAEADILNCHWPLGSYDVVVAVFIQFLSPAERPPVFASLRDALRPNGLFLLQGYRPEQVPYGTGGPGRVEHMYTREWLEAEFAGWNILHLSARDTDLAEGHAHRGRSAVIDLVARRPSVRSKSG